MLMENGYPRTSIEAWSKQLERTGVAKEQDEMISTVCLPYVKGLSEAVARILRKVQIRVVSQPESRKWSVMTGVEDKVEVVERAGVVYALDRKDCGLSILGKPGGELRSVHRSTKLMRKHGRTELSAVAEHAWGSHALDWTTRVLGLEQVTKERKIHEALAIHTQDKAGGTLNRDSGIELSKLWF